MTYTSHLYTGAEMGSAMNLGAVQTGENAAKVGGKRRKNFRTLATHTHEPNSRLWMRAHFSAVNDADSIDLCLPSC